MKKIQWLRKLTKESFESEHPLLFQYFTQTLGISYPNQKHLEFLKKTILKRVDMEKMVEYFFFLYNQKYIDFHNLNRLANYFIRKFIDKKWKRDNSQEVAVALYPFFHKFSLLEERSGEAGEGRVLWSRKKNQKFSFYSFSRHYFPIFREWIVNGAQFEINLSDSDVSRILWTSPIKPENNDYFKVLMTKYRKVLLTAGNFGVVERFILAKNMELAEFMFDQFPQLLNYEPTYEVIGQLKSVDISFLHPILDRIEKENRYETLPEFSTEESGIRYLTNKRDSSVIIRLLKMQRIQYLSLYLGDAVEKKIFPLLDYLLEEIVRVDPVYLTSGDFRQKIAGKSLFYEDFEREELKKIWEKYGLDEGVVGMRGGDQSYFTTPSAEHCKCHICLDEFDENDSGRRLFCCQNCKNSFHPHCIFDYMKAQSHKIENNSSGMSPDGDDISGQEGGAEIEINFDIDLSEQMNISNGFDLEDDWEEEGDEEEGEEELGDLDDPYVDMTSLFFKINCPLCQCKFALS